MSKLDRLQTLMLLVAIAFGCYVSYHQNSKMLGRIVGGGIVWAIMLVFLWIRNDSDESN